MQDTPDIKAAGTAHSAEYHHFFACLARYMAAAHRVILASVWLLQETPYDIKVQLGEQRTHPQQGQGDRQTLEQIGLIDMEPVGYGQPGAETGQTTTPIIAKAPPNTPSRDTEISYTTPDWPNSASACCRPPVAP